MKKRFIIPTLIATTLASSGCDLDVTKSELTEVLERSEKVCIEQKCNKLHLHKAQILEILSSTEPSVHAKIRKAANKIIELHSK